MWLSIRQNWFLCAAISLLIATVAVYAYTENYFFLPIPFAFLYFAWLGVNWKSAYWMFIALIPVSIQINFNSDANSITLPDQPMMWSFFLLLFIILARNPKALPEWWLKDKVVLLAALQYLWLGVAVVFSKVLFFSCKFMLAKTWLMACYFVFPVFIFTNKQDFIRAFRLMLVPMFLTILVILAHHALLGFKFDKIQKALTNLYYNHVDYSSLISMFFPLLLVAYPLTKGRSIVTRGALIVVILLYLAGIYFAFARAAYFAVVFAIVVGIAIKMRLVNLIMPVFYAFFMMLCYMVNNNKFMDFRPDYNKTYMHKDFTDHIISTFRGKDMSSMERLYRWIAAIRMSKDRPITGYGPHGFYYYYKPYAVNSFKTYVSRNNEHSTTHNYYIYMLVEQGWPAMLMYGLLIPLLFAKAQRIYHRFTDKFYRAATIGLIMTIAAGFVNNFFSELIDTHKVGSLFYLPIALLIILDHKSKQEAKGMVID